MKNLDSTTKAGAVMLLNQMRNKGQKHFTIEDFDGCENAIQIENRYITLLNELFD